MEEAMSGTFPLFPVQSEVVNSDDVRVSKKQITDTGDNLSSAHVLLTNDDLLIEILLRLPVISIIIFKLVSKQWLSIITSPDFIMRRNQIPNVDPASGLFLQSHDGSSILCDFMSLDSRIPSRKSLIQTTFNFGSSKAGNDFRILQSCNGLLLCNHWTGSYSMFYVFNPSTNLFKVLPQHDTLNLKLTHVGGGMRMAFDCTKSPYYKVVHVGQIDDDKDNMQIQTYSSETGNWSVCCDQFPFKSFNSFADGIYWNDAFYWLKSVSDQHMHFKLSIADHDHPILTTIQSPLPSWHWNRDLFEARGCLLHLCRDYINPQDINPQEFSIYEMMNDSSEWSLKYRINVDGLILPLPRSWFVCSTIWSIVLGEREEDSFIVIKLSGKVLKYKFLSKTLRKLYDLGSTNYNPKKYQFIASLASV